MALLIAPFWWVGGSSLTSAAPPPSQVNTSQDAPLSPKQLATERLTPEQQLQLDNCREGILDAHARPEDRRRWVELLFSLDPAVSGDLAVQLLSLSDKPDVQLTLCEVITTRARTTPDRLQASYIEPLVALLGAERSDLRTASGRALADFPGVDTSTRLGELASDGNAPTNTRLSAIDTLALRVDRRDVVRELVGLLNSDVDEITARVVAALEPASRETFGRDIEQWRAWWSVKSKMTNEAWLTDRLQMYRQRLRTVEGNARRLRSTTDERHAGITDKLHELQREVYRGLSSEDERSGKLADWLASPMTEVQAAALAIIRGHITDEGRSPPEQVLAALLGLLQHGSPQIERDVLLIVQTLKGPSVVDAVLQQLDQERDAGMRKALLRAVGKLRATEAVGMLVGEIASPHSDRECVAEAAVSLGKIASQANGDADCSDAVAALDSRYGLVAENDTALRAALLQAMAGVADATFEPVFIEAMESDFTEILRPAIRGLIALGSVEKLSRIRSLLSSPDPLVRQAAIEAVGTLGSEEADLESLLVRINPNGEPEEQLREFAWRGVRSLLSKKPYDQRIIEARRLRDTPDLEVRYLQELKDELINLGGEDVNLAVVRDQLATVLMDQQKYAEAAVQLSELFETTSPNGDDDSVRIGLRWLKVSLHVPGIVNITDVVLRLLASPDGQNPDNETVKEIISTVATYLDSAEAVANKAATLALVARLRDVPSDQLGAPWNEMLQRAEDKVNSTPAESNDKPLPQG